MQLLSEIQLAHRAKTNWYVITGGPSSGKTTTVNILKERGYKTTVELARYYLDLNIKNGKTTEEIRSNQFEFQSGILNLQIEKEKELSPTEIVFLDRAIPDDLAYYRYRNLKEDAKILEAVKNASYKKIFMLDCLPLVNDYARNEDEAAQKRIHEILMEVYKSLPFPLIQVPVLPAQERVDFILNNL